MQPRKNKLWRTTYKKDGHHCDHHKCDSSRCAIYYLLLPGVEFSWHLPLPETITDQRIKDWHYRKRKYKARGKYHEIAMKHRNTTGSVPWLIMYFIFLQQCTNWEQKGRCPHDRNGYFGPFWPRLVFQGSADCHKVIYCYTKQAKNTCKKRKPKQCTDLFYITLFQNFRRAKLI